MREEQREFGAGGTTDKHTTNAVAPARPGHKGLDGVLLPLRVLPVGSLGQVQAPVAPGLVGQQSVSGLRRQESEFGGDATRAGRTTEEAAQLTQRQVIHGKASQSQSINQINNEQMNYSSDRRGETTGLKISTGNFLREFSLYNVLTGDWTPSRRWIACLIFRGKSGSHRPDALVINPA